MADNITDRVKKQKEDAEKRKKEQEAAGGGSPSSPFGVANQGSTEDQAKMAGTPNAMMGSSITDQSGDAPAAATEETALGNVASQQQEIDATAQDDTLQTELGEKTFDDEQRTAAQERAKAFSDKMQTFGSLGQRVENMVTGAFSGLNANKTEKNLAKTKGFELNESQLKELVAPGTNTEELGDILTEFTSLGRDDPQKAYEYLASNSNKFKNPSSGIMDMIEAAYSKDPEVLHSTVANLVANDIVDPDQVNFDQLIKSGFVNVDEDGNITELGISTDDLQEILGDDWGSLTPEQIGEQVEETRQESLDNTNKIKEQLSDPNLPPQTRVALLDELKRMGAIGAIQYEQQAKEAQVEAADSGKVMIGGEVQDVATMLQDEEIKDEVVNFLSDPDSPENKKWAEDNHEFAEWLGREMDSLNLTKESLESNLDNFGKIQKKNESFVTENISAKGGKLDTDIMNIFGFGGQGFQAANYQAGDDPVYDMLSNLESGTQTAQAVGIINDLPDSQKAQLKGLPADKLKDLLTNPDKMQEFATIATMKDSWNNAQNSNNVDEMANVILGEGGAEAARARMSDLYAKMQFGGSPEIKKQYELMKTVFDQNGDGHIDDPQKVKAAIDNLLSEEGDLSSMVESGLAGRISDFRSMGDAGDIGNGLFDRIKGALGPGDTEITNEDLDKIQGDMDLGTLEQLMDSKLQGFGIDRNKVKSLMAAKATSSIDNILNDPTYGLRYDDLKPSEHRNATEATEAFKQSRGRLEELARSGHTLERDAAIKKLREMNKKITESSPMAWKDVSNTSRHMTKIRPLDKPPKGFEHLMTKTEDGKYRLMHVKEGGYDAKRQDMVHQWATWQNFAKDPNDLNEFFSAIKGRTPGLSTSGEKKSSALTDKIFKRRRRY